MKCLLRHFTQNYEGQKGEKIMTSFTSPKKSKLWTWWQYLRKTQSDSSFGDNECLYRSWDLQICTFFLKTVLTCFMIYVQRIQGALSALCFRCFMTLTEKNEVTVSLITNNVTVVCSVCVDVTICMLTCTIYDWTARHLAAKKISYSVVFW